MRLLKGASVLSLLLVLSGCWWIWEDTPYDITAVIASPSMILYDEELNEFYNEDTLVIDTAQIIVKVYHVGEFTVRVLDYVGALSRVDGGYIGDIPLAGLFDSIPTDTVLTCYIEEAGTVLDSCKITITRLKASLLSQFAVSEDILIYDSTDTQFLDRGRVVVDTLQFTVEGISQGTISVLINEIATPFVTLDTFHIASVPLASLAGSISDTTNMIAYLIDNGDTVDMLTIHLYPQLFFDEPFIKYAWHIGYGDPTYMDEWHIDAGSSVGIYDAWQITRGSGVTVAIIDDGFDVTHEDLAGNVIDTYNAIDEGTNVEGSYSGTWHGTTVAGFVGAPINNTGIAGVSPEVSLVIIKDGYTDAETIRAFQYAKRSGAQVVNCRWGTYSVSDAIADAIQELYDAGITVVFASGNSGRDLDDAGINDESELPTVLGIGASNEDNDVWSLSNYGSNLEVISPGEAVVGLNKMGSGGSQSQRGVVDENYFFGSGTSYSCPIVSGVAALLYAVNPILTPEQVRTIVIETTEKVGGSDANYINGFDTKRLYGKIDAVAAVQRARSY